MRKSLFVSICWMVGLLGMALSAQAQTPPRVVDLNGQGVAGVTIAVTGQCTERGSTTPPQTVTSTSQTDSTGGFAWTVPCSGSVAGSYTYSFAKSGYYFTKGGNFIYQYNFFFLFPALDERVPLVYAAPASISKWTAVSAADYGSSISNEMILAGFGSGIATTTAAATLPLPTTMDSRKIVVRDMNGKEAAARFLFISPNQINFVMPSGLAEGACAVKLLDSADNVRFVDLPVLFVSRPSLFTANADGKGVPAALIVRVKPGNVQSFEPVAQFDQQLKKWVPLPIDLGPATETVFLVLYGTGWHANTGTTVTLAGTYCDVAYTGPQLVLAGLDQINARIPRSLIGRGDVNLEVGIIFNKLPYFSSTPTWPLKIK